MNLFIIGNGFDLNHGLRTSYWDYRLFLSKHNPMIMSSNDHAEYMAVAETSPGTRNTEVTVSDALYVQKIGLKAE